MMVTVVACDAPPEEGAAAFRTVDASGICDDEETWKGAPDDLCDDCGSYWMDRGDELGIYLEADVGAGVLPLNETAHIFFKGAERGVKFAVTSEFNCEFSLHVIRLQRLHLRPPTLERLHLVPELGKEEAVLRFENDKASIDVRLNRFKGHRASTVDEAEPVNE